MATIKCYRTKVMVYSGLMRTYLVGGAVRDKLLGIPPKDHDYVLVNVTREELERRGFQRVGASYDVFLHPKTKEEYVLAEDLLSDLKRRDITINSMALDEEGVLVDPFNGKKDLEDKWLHHTSEHFSDDPLRLYRLARFCAQWPDFNIHPDTLKIAQDISKTRAFIEIHANRVLNEFQNALESKCPGRFFQTLDILGASYLYFNNIKKWERIEETRPDSLFRFCYLAQWMNRADIVDLCEKLGVPGVWKINALAATRAIELLQNKTQGPQELIDFYYDIDAFRRPELIIFLRDLFGEKFFHVKEGYFLIRKVNIDMDGLSGLEIARAMKKKRTELLEEKRSS